MLVNIIELVVLLSVVGAFLFFQVPRWISTIGIALVLGLFMAYSPISTWMLIIAWLVFVPIAVLLNVPQLRKHFISAPILKYLKKALPPMTSTEKIALDAGDVWWDAELFQGAPNWRELLDINKPEFSAEEQAFIDNELSTLCGMLNEWEFMREGDISEAAWTYIKEQGFLGLIIPKQYGGKEFSALAHSQIVMQLASRSPSTAVSVMVPNSLGPAELIMHYGTDEQKNHYLPRLASGEEIPCFALTGPDAGSDAGAIADFGLVTKGQYKGKEVLGIKLTWDKRYITLAPVATLLGIAFKLYDPEHLLGDKRDLGITLGLIPTSHSGVETGARHAPMNMPIMNGITRGKDVFIPMDYLIGGQAMIGEGWRMLMESLSVGRSISLPALATATAKVSYLTCGAYSKIREQFNLPLGKFEGIAEQLGHIGGYTYLIEATRVMTANAVDRGLRPSLISAIAKYHMTEIGRKTILAAMDIQAGRAIQMGDKNYLAALYQSSPVSITVEGANILTRNLMIFGQGAMRCHPYVKQEIELANTPDALNEFDAVLQKHLGYSIRNVVRSFAYGLTRGWLIQTPVKNHSARYLRQLTRMSSALSWLSDFAMLKLGGNLKRRESLSARLGDVLSYLYLGSTVVKYYNDNGADVADNACFDWAMQTCLHEIQTAVSDFIRNFTPGVLGWALRFVIFPLGRHYHAPDDRLQMKIAEQMMEPSQFRDRLTDGVFWRNDTNDAIGLLEITLEKRIQLKAILATLREAKKAGAFQHAYTFEDRLAVIKNENILTDAESKQYQEYEVLRREVVAVDEFEFDELLGAGRRQSAQIHAIN